MPRNLDGRVECLAPVTNPALTPRLEEILSVNLADDVLAWELGPDGWHKLPTRVGVNAHERLQALAEERAAAAAPRGQAPQLVHVRSGRGTGSPRPSAVGSP